MVAPANAPMTAAAAPAKASSSDSASPMNKGAVQDHPEGAEIRRQVRLLVPNMSVEYYFSDENLRFDLHMLQNCGGRDNNPVSISRICGFGKMRQYKPKGLVTAALRLSDFLEVSADGKQIKRKIPLQGKCLLDADFEDIDDFAYDPRVQKKTVQKPAQFPVPPLPQEKAKYPQGLSKNMLKPTGFEEGYVEPILTPDEAEVEEDMYSTDKHFVERIEIAIQRFKQKRRMHEKYAIVFNKLMRFGGVESGTRMYQGKSKRDMEQWSAEEIARALAVHHVPWTRSDEKKWVVDFVAICKAFLSSWYPANFGFGLEGIKNACQVPRSFFRYLRYHSVCPEYDHQLAVALKICDLAEKELPKVNAIGIALPGDFNQSASIVFGGAQAGMYIGDKLWAQELRKGGMDIEEIGMREEEARIRFGTSIAVLGSDEQFDMLERGSLKVLNKESAYLEVTAIHFPSEDSRIKFAEMNKSYKHKLVIEPLGKLICKTTYTDDGSEWDLPKDTDKYPHGKPRKADEGKEYEFWIEEDILLDCFVGLKMEVDILMLSGGLAIIDTIKETMCSFYTWIPNELWMSQKPKEVRWLKKGMGLDEEETEGVDTTAGEGKQVADRAASDDEFDDE
ncbi:Argonaute complex subunit Arb1 [Pyrenophora seminiperda CCB06]|uniref:Argonaute complex subunit Arb1 n=1 Tax=Pyrenophora seminiperda CCB06 TaxID=1302712 RepID=A0A3M7MDQ1_9PLEO|nr:Argonaute complex subunit Arb1 [Pyrenophora seminiperda CCB06]